MLTQCVQCRGDVARTVFKAGGVCATQKAHAPRVSLPWPQGGQGGGSSRSTVGRGGGPQLGAGGEPSPGGGDEADRSGAGTLEPDFWEADEDAGVAVRRSDGRWAVAMGALHAVPHVLSF